MLSLSPILNFQQTQKAAAEQLAQTIRTSWMPTALTFALAEMSSRNATREELIGARIFIGILMNLAEPLSPPTPALPSKELGQKQAENK